MTNRIVLIDVGHGGTDPGAVWKQDDGSIIKEADKAFAIADYCGVYLQSRFIESFFTRIKSPGKRITASDRIAEARKLKPACFVSIHCNAAESTEAHGWEILVPVKMPLKLATDIENEWRESNLDMKWRCIRQREKKDRGGMLLNGVHNLGIPCCLVEVGFLTNKHDRGLICDPDWQKKCGQAIAQGIIEFLKDGAK